MSQWRGYGEVRQLTGAQGTGGMVSRTDSYFLRGMHGDRAGPSGGTKSVSVTLGAGEGDPIVDHSSLAGFPYKTVLHKDAAGGALEKTITRPWYHRTARSVRDWGTIAAHFIGAEHIRTFTSLDNGAGGTWRITEQHVTHDTVAGRVTQVDDRGDTSTSEDDRCVRTTWATNTAKNLLNLQEREEVVAARCSATPDRSEEVLSDVRYAYDGGAYGATPTLGDVTGTATLKEHDGTRATYLEAGAEYDTHGRIVATTDISATVTVTGEGPITLLEHTERFPARVRDARWAAAGTPTGPDRLPDPDRLLAAADRGPVVSLVVGRRHGDALVAAGGTVRRVELPLLTRNAVGATLGTLRDAIALARDAGAPAPRRSAAELEVDAVLRWLWDAVAGPVLTALGPRWPAPDAPGTPGGPPRLWWVTGGALARLPLHAAGRYDGPAARVVFSTVPSIRSLLLARERAAARRTTPETAGRREGGRPRNGVVVVGDGVDAGSARLPGLEIAAVRGLLPDAPVFGGPGTGDPRNDPQEVTRALRHAGIAHAVGGVGGKAHPLDGRGPRVAYLSEYGSPPTTDDGEMTAPPPTVNLHLAGVPSVVGPLWPWAGDPEGPAGPEEPGEPGEPDRAGESGGARDAGDGPVRAGAAPPAPGDFAVELAREFHLRLRRAGAEGEG
ncbi:hypothetical protein FNX48_015015, partial [Streptomyces sp. IF17]|nr:hypothetical protein [Streptomyces alkaliphilus]